MTVPIFWQGTPVRDPKTGEEFTCSILGSLQPGLADGVFRALLGKPGAPAYDIANAKMQLCRYTDNGWIIDGPAPSLRDESWHPDLCNGDGEYIALARQVLAHLPRPHRLEVMLTTEEDHKGRHEGAAAVYYHPTGAFDSTQTLYVNSHGLAYIPGASILEKDADRFWTTLNVKIDEEEGGLLGEFSLQVSADSLLIEYENLDQFSITFESKLSNGAWSHTTTFDAPKPSLNAIEEMKRLASDPVNNFLADYAESGLVYADNLPSNVTVLSVSEIERGFDRYVVEPGNLRSGRHESHAKHD